MEFSKKKLPIEFILVFVLTLLIFQCNSLPDKPKKIPIDNYTYLNQYLNRYIPSQMKDESVIGLSINLVSDKEVLFAKGYGFSDKAKGIKVTPDTIFRVASISKIVNLVVVMKLVEQGKLNLDTDITKYLPELKMKSRFENSKPITIRSILTHHSGLPSERLKGFFSYSKTDSLEELVSQINGEYVSYPPEKIFSYSNLAHSILGRIVEKVSKETYFNAVNRIVFQPLKMDHSFFEINLDNKLEVSKGYGGTLLEPETNEAKLRDLPAGFLHSSVNDISKFIQMFLNGGKIGNQIFLKESTLEEIYKAQNSGNPYDDEFQIGLGFFLNNLNLGREIFTLQHGGDTYLFHAMLAILPRQKLGVIVLSNSFRSASLVQRVTKKSLEIALETKLGYEKSLRGISKGNEIDMNTFSGTYQNGNLMEVEVEDGKVFSSLILGSRVIFPNKENEWQLSKLQVFGIFDISQNLLLKFKKVGEDRILYTKSGGSVSIWGSKIPQNKNGISEAWKARVGSYKILNEDKDNASLLEDTELKIINDFLVFENKGLPAAKIKLKQKFALTIINDNEAIIAGLGRAKGDTISVKKSNGKEVLTYSGYEMQRIE